MELLPVAWATASHPRLITSFLLIGIAASSFVNPQSLDPGLTTVRQKSWFVPAGWWQRASGSLALWAALCGAAVVVLHHATSDYGARLGAYRTGILTFLLFIVAALTVMRRRIAKRLPHVLVRNPSQHKLQQDQHPHYFSHAIGIGWSIKPKTWQRIHIGFALGAMLPLWWHCDLGRASDADLLLKGGAMLLLTFGFLGVSITDLTRWRLLSPLFSPRLSSGLIKGLFTVHRWLALITFILIGVHVLAVLYFAGI